MKQSSDIEKSSYCVLYSPGHPDRPSSLLNLAEVVHPDIKKVEDLVQIPKCLLDAENACLVAHRLPGTIWEMFAKYHLFIQ
jgi:hypothetical protein